MEATDFDFSLAPPEFLFFNRAAPSQILSNALLDTCNIAITVVCSGFVLLGLFTNSANILVFWRLGFSSVSNINLFFLSVFDMMIIVLCAYFVVCSNAFYSLVTFMSGYALVLIVHPLYFSGLAMSSCITALISMERCCCVMLPMKVKQMFTRRTVAGTLLVMILYELATTLPHFLSMALTRVKSPLTNKTILAFDFINYNERVGILSTLLSFSIPTSISFLIVIVGTILLVVKLQQSSNFRRSIAGNSWETAISARDRTLSRSIIGICVMYIVCLSPNVVIFLVSTAFPPFHIRDPVYGNVAYLSINFGILVQGINASMNMFVYLHMMSPYRKTFKKLFLPSTSSAGVERNNGIELELE